MIISPLWWKMQNFETGLSCCSPPHFPRADIHQLFFAEWDSHYVDDIVLTADTTQRNSSTVERVTNSGTAMHGVVSRE